jgi:hypothetical protein
MSRKPSDASEFQAKIALDQEMVRGKIPSPLLRQMGARPGDYMTFRLVREGWSEHYLKATVDSQTIKPWGARWKPRHAAREARSPLPRANCARRSRHVI